jgi:hypothetical protein
MLPDGLFVTHTITILIARGNAGWVRGRMPRTAGNMPALPTAFWKSPKH